jgi:teichuronic acid biosynthesis glycosyltransferase TuaH
MSSARTIVFLSHSPDLGAIKVGSHHLSRELARRGHRVAHVSTPVSIAHLAKLRSPSVRRRFKLAGQAHTKDGVVHVVPFAVAPPALVWRGERPRQWLSGWTTALKQLRKCGFDRPDFVLIDQPTMAPIAYSIQARSVIYRPTDIHTSKVLRDAELHLLRTVNGLVATSEPVLESMVGHVNADVPRMLLPNGVEWRHFSSGARTSTRRGYAYVGAVDERFDIGLLYAMAADLPDEPFVIAGPVSISAGKPPSNVRYLGPVPYEAAPTILASAKVGLLPLSSVEVNLGRSPMKYFEYLAAGVHVLARSSPALQDLAAPGVHLYRDAGEAIEMAAGLAGAEENMHGVDFARGFDWGRRAEALEAFLVQTLRN